MEEKISNIINWKDEYYNSKNKLVLTASELQIPGLKTFGRQVRTAANDVLPLHFHEDAYEIVYIASGTVSFSIDEKTYNLSGGDVFITKPNVIHSTHTDPVSRSEMYWFQIDFTNNSNALFLTKSSVKSIATKLSKISTPKIETDLEWIGKLFKKAFKIASSDSNPEFTAQYLSLLLYEIIEYSSKTAFKLTPDIGKAIIYICDHAAEIISLETLANESYLSTSQFKQKFKKQLGISPRQFINSQKIDLSKTLLLEGHSISETAEMLSFDTSTYFTIVFKKFNLCTPSEYIKTHKNT